MALYSTTKENIVNAQGSTNFKCPRCLQTSIIRSHHERAIVAKFTCSSCGFTGPN